MNPFPLINWGPFGVALFFLISGFVIPFSFRTADRLAFALNRFFRLVPVYVCGFSVTLLAILISVKYFGGAWPLTTSEILSHYIPGLRDVLWSPSIDAIVWTLEIEVKFYLICALAIPLFKRSSLLVFVAPAILFCAAYWIFPNLKGILNINIYLYRAAFLLVYNAPFLVFMFIGTSIHYAYRKVINFDQATAMIAVLFFTFCLMIQTGIHKPLLAIIWSYGAALVVFLVSYAFRDYFRPRRITSFFADISYPLYVVHGISGYVILRISLESGVPISISIAAATMFAILAAWFLHCFVEKPSQHLSKSIYATVAAPTVEATNAPEPLTQLTVAEIEPT